MTEQSDEKEKQIDWEWEYLKLQNRIKDCYGEIADLKEQYKKMNARITRMQYTSRQEEGEEEEPEEGEREGELSLEEKAIKISELLDKVESNRLRTR